MRQIDISIDTFAAIWALRRNGENSENDILMRILKDINLYNTPKNSNTLLEQDKTTPEPRPNNFLRANPSWWEVIKIALENLDGQAHLSDLYRETRNVCEQISKPIPRNLPATVRGTLEDNCSESDRYKRVRDVFTMPNGKHRGFWGVR